MLFLPDGTPEQMAWYEDLLWRSTTAEAAAALYRARGGLNVCDLAPQVRARTLVMHARDDRVVPAQEGRLLATLIPDAHFVCSTPRTTSCSSRSRPGMSSWPRSRRSSAPMRGLVCR
jgi:hypothetical protein